MESELKTFGERLSFALTEKKISQVKLAQKLGIKQQAVSVWVKDKGGCKQAYEVAQALHVSPDWLINGVGSMEMMNDEFIEIMRKIEDPQLKAELQALALKRLLEK